MKKLKRYKAERGTMTQEKRVRQRFSEDVGRHVGSGDPISTECTIGDVVANEVMTNINMFRTRGDSGIVGQRTSTLIIRKKGKRTRNRKRKKSKKDANPKGFFKSMGHGIVFSFSRGERDRLLFNRRPRNEAVEKIETISGDTPSVKLIRGPISIRDCTIPYKTANHSRNCTPIKVEFKR